MWEAGGLQQHASEISASLETLGIVPYLKILFWLGIIIFAVRYLEHPALNLWKGVYGELRQSASFKWTRESVNGYALIAVIALLLLYALSATFRKFLGIIQGQHVELFFEMLVAALIIFVFAVVCISLCHYFAQRDGPESS